MPIVFIAIILWAILYDKSKGRIFIVRKSSLIIAIVLLKLVRTFDLNLLALNILITLAIGAFLISEICIYIKFKKLI